MFIDMEALLLEQNEEKAKGAGAMPYRVQAPYRMTGTTRRHVQCANCERRRVPGPEAPLEERQGPERQSVGGHFVPLQQPSIRYGVGQCRGERRVQRQQTAEPVVASETPGADDAQRQHRYSAPELGHPLAVLEPVLVSVTQGHDMRIVGLNEATVFAPEGGHFFYK